MSQQNLEILGEEWIALSPVESKYSGLTLREDAIAAKDSIAAKDYLVPVDFIGSEDFIDSENFIDSKDSLAVKDYLGSEYLIFPEDLTFQEDSIAPEYAIDSEESIAPQKIDFDPLIGTPRIWGGPWPGTNNGSQVSALKDARLNIGTDLWYWNRKYVTATVKVELSSSDINSGGLRLQSSVWGIDNTFYDRRDDLLFYFPDQYISQSGTYTFSAVVGSGKLDEDRWWFDQRDEIQASISLVSNRSPDPFNRRITTNIFTGWF